MDNHLLTSASEDTLVTAFGTREIQSATNLHSGQDTPHPETRLSTETVQVLKDTAARRYEQLLSPTKQHEEMAGN